MTMGSLTRRQTSDDYGFTDEETDELSFQEIIVEQVSPEEDLEAARETRLVDL